MDGGVGTILQMVYSALSEVASQWHRAGTCWSFSDSAGGESAAAGSSAAGCGAEADEASSESGEATAAAAEVCPVASAAVSGGASACGSDAAADIIGAWLLGGVDGAVSISRAEVAVTAASVIGRRRRGVQHLRSCRSSITMMISSVVMLPVNSTTLLSWISITLPSRSAIPAVA